MNPFSILMFCFSGALFLYAALLAITKDVQLIPRMHAAKVKDGKQYAAKFAGAIAMAAVPPAHCGLVALFSPGWAVVVLIAELIFALWAATVIVR